MKLPEGVEWALHCTWLLAVAADRDGDALPTRRLAEFYGLPEAYLAKLLKALVRAGLLSATSGPRGGFRLARPPAEISVAQVLEAVEGPGPLFPCTEIRQRGPVPLTGAACRTPCGIAQVMHRAEDAWRQELAATTIADLVHTAGTGAASRVGRWLEPRRRAAPPTGLPRRRAAPPTGLPRQRAAPPTGLPRRRGAPPTGLRSEE